MCASPVPTFFRLPRFSFTFKSVSGAAAEVLRRTLCMYVKDYVEVQPSGAVFPNYLEDWCLKYHEFPVQKDDVWVVTYPKAGQAKCFQSFLVLDV